MTKVDITLVDGLIDEKNAEIKRLTEVSNAKSKVINYCIGHIHNVSQLKYIEKLCRDVEKLKE